MEKLAETEEDGFSCGVGEVVFVVGVGDDMGKGGPDCAAESNEGFSVAIAGLVRVMHKVSSIARLRKKA